MNFQGLVRVSLIVFILSNGYDDVCVNLKNALCGVTEFNHRNSFAERYATTSALLPLRGAFECSATSVVPCDEIYLRVDQQLTDAGWRKNSFASGSA
jgi:hypothetical protein